MKRTDELTNEVAYFDQDDNPVCWFATFDVSKRTVSNDPRATSHLCFVRNEAGELEVQLSQRFSMGGHNPILHRPVADLSSNLDEFTLLLLQCKYGLTGQQYVDLVQQAMGLLTRESEALIADVRAIAERDNWPTEAREQLETVAVKLLGFDIN